MSVNRRFMTPIVLSITRLQSTVALIASFSHICVAMACCAIFLGVLLILLAYFIRKKDPKPIFGVYTRPGKWYYLKYVVFACLYYFRKVSVLPVTLSVLNIATFLYIYATI